MVVPCLGYILALCSVCCSVIPASAQSNGMDASMDGPMNLAVGNMLPYVHFTPGDTVWFIGWVPSSAGAMVGTCIGLFLLSMLERWVTACLAIAEEHWDERTNALVIDKSDSVASLPSPSESLASSPLPNNVEAKLLQLPPFVAEFDITRGVLFGAQKFLQILLMMVVMTFQLAFIFAMAIGSGVGETLFGRYSLSSLTVHEH